LSDTSMESPPHKAGLHRPLVRALCRRAGVVRRRIAVAVRSATTTEAMLRPRYDHVRSRLCWCSRIGEHRRDAERGCLMGNEVPAIAGTSSDATWSADAGLMRLRVWVLHRDGAPVMRSASATTSGCRRDACTTALGQRSSWSIKAFNASPTTCCTGPRSHAAGPPSDPNAPPPFRGIGLRR
jgi:hypothetical protein